jgi:hypothetical protein
VRSTAGVAAVRRDVPRFRSPSSGLLLGELDGPLESNQIESLRNLVDFEGKVTRWQRSRDRATAEEVIEAALLLGSPEEGNDAAAFIVSEVGDPEVRLLAETVLARPSGPHSRLALKDQGPDGPDVAVSIAKIRSRLKSDHHDVLAWLELGRLRLIFGQRDSARRALAVAHDLAPNSVLIARSVASGLVALGEPDVAHKILRTARSDGKNPLLLASEIATAALAGEKGPARKDAARVLSDDRFSLRTRSELAAELLTEAVVSSKSKAERRGIERLMTDPNENALAQVEWLTTDDKGLLSTRTLEAGASEALAYRLFTRGDLAGALLAAQGWLDDQPFSPDACCMVSSLLSTHEANFEASLAVARRGLRVQPAHPLLLAGEAYFLVETGQLREAAKVIRDVHAKKSLDRISEVALVATEGLLAFRSGSLDLGRAKYARAIHLAKTRNHPEQVQLARVMWAREELAHDRSEANRLIDGIKSPIGPVVKRWTGRVQELRLQVDSAPLVRR